MRHDADGYVHYDYQDSWSHVYGNGPLVLFKFPHPFYIPEEYLQPAALPDTLGEVGQAGTVASHRNLEKFSTWSASIASTYYDGDWGGFNAFTADLCGATSHAGAGFMIPAAALDTELALGLVWDSSSCSNAQFVQLEQYSDWIRSVANIPASPTLYGDLLWRCVPQAPATACGATPAGSTAVWRGANPAMTTYPGAVGFDWSIVGTGDFNNDQKKDILWRSVNGDNVIWPGATAPGYWISPVSTSWNVAGVGDFNNNGKSDILWRSINGDNAIWTDGNAPGYWIGSLGTNWYVAGVGDFNCNNKSDILWRSVYGDNVVWTDGNAPGYWLSPLNNDWTVAGVGDFDADCHADILWRSTSGDNVIWYNGTSPGQWIAFLDTGWNVVGIDDIDKNGKSDIVWRRANGDNAIWLDATSTFLLRPLDTNWQVAGVGDFMQ
jgi:hypothetical protein